MFRHFFLEFRLDHRDIFILSCEIYKKKKKKLEISDHFCNQDPQY